jgi:hypothetical protein
MTIVLNGKGEPLSLDPSGPIQTTDERIGPSGRKRLQQSASGLCSANYPLASRHWASKQWG